MGQCLSAGLACFWIYLQHWSSTVRDAVNTFQRSWSSTFKTDDWIYHLVSLLINAHYTARVIAFWKSQETFKKQWNHKIFLEVPCHLQVLAIQIHLHLDTWVPWNPSLPNKQKCTLVLCKNATIPLPASGKSIPNCFNPVSIWVYTQDSVSLRWIGPLRRSK